MIRRLTLALLLLTAGTLCYGAQQTIGVGTVVNDGTGDTGRTAFGKVNTNFTELYTHAGAPIYIPTVYGSCTWDSTHDVGSCINLAIAAAATAGGGTILLPCGLYGVSTQILQQTTGVRLVGCGVGIPRDTFNTANFIAATRLLWIGAGTANPVLLVQTASGGGTVISSADVIGLAVDCGDICDTAIRINGVVGSTFVIGGAESVKTNIEFTTPTDLEASGNQRNDIWAFSRSSSASNSPTGILFDAGCSLCFNTSYNVMHTLAAYYRKGDGIVFGDSDNNTVELIKDTPATGATGSAVVVANSLYTMPNGNTVKNYARQLRVLHDGSHGTHVTGFQTNSTFTAVGGNGGTAALAPLTIATSAGSAGGTSTLTFASTTGTLSGETVSCGGPVNGVFNGTPVLAVTATTVTVNPAQFVAAVPISTNCIFTYGITQAAQAGSYTLTATAAAIYTLTAPAGGHTQTGIVPSGGFLTFTDMLIPWTGTASVNDSWTIVVPTAPQDVAFEDLDKGNSLPNPTFELGTTGSYWPSTALYPIGWQMPCIIGSASNLGGKPPTTAGSSACVLGGNSGSATGTSSIVVGGENNSVSSEAGAAIGGSGLTVSGFGATATGQDNTASGADSFITGKGATDRGRFASHCLGGAIYAAQGDNQTCFELLKGTGATGSAIRLTNNAAAAGSTNCFNIPNNSGYAITIDIMAWDHTTVTKFASWNALTGLLTRGANAASTALAVASATPAVTYSGGSLVGNAMSITADTTNGCLNISWTPPTSNTDTWNVTARVSSVEVQ